MAPPLLRVLAVATMLRISGCVFLPGAALHSLKYFYTAVSEDSPGPPRFAVFGYVDEQPFVYYNIKTQKAQPQVPWMEKVEEDDSEYWDRNTQFCRESDEVFRQNLEILRNRYNQSKGFHTLQWMYGCELRADGSKGGFEQHGYDGRTFITFDKEALRWVALSPEAQITQRKWDAFPGYNQHQKFYLEEICIEWLERYLSYGKESLPRAEPPVVTVSRKTEEDGMETHVCRAHGFYPKEIDASWRREGEVWLEDTHHGLVAPNPDGTFHYWLSIKVDPKERELYRCHVEHDGLEEALDVAVKDPDSNLWSIISCVLGAALVGIFLILGIWTYRRRRRETYKAAPTSDGGSSNSSPGSTPAI